MRSKGQTRVFLLALALVTTSILCLWLIWPGVLEELKLRVLGKRTVRAVVDEHGPRVREKLYPLFAAAGSSYPPTELALLALKEEKSLEVWAKTVAGWRYVEVYPVLGASGKSGPKLREGDLQVPEGIYHVESLNPNSAFHLSIKVNYPNAFDIERAKVEGRVKLGGDIFIHGGRASIGCLAMGDPAIEELFVLVADTGADKTKIVIAPWDFRTRSPKEPEQEWDRKLYENIRGELQHFRSSL